MSFTAPLAVDLAKETDVLQLYPDVNSLFYHQAKDGVQLRYDRHPPHQVSENYSKQHRIFIHDRNLLVPLVEEIAGNRIQNEHLKRGDISIVPANVSNWACWDTEHQYIMLVLAPSLFERLTPDLTNAEAVDLLPSFSQPAPLIHGLGLALKSELESSGLANRLYVDSLLAALLAYLVRHYSTHKFQNCVNNFSQRQLRQRLQPVIDYINEHIDRNLTLAELARVAQISPSYFSELFKQATGLAPHQYVIQCRIERAKRLLRHGELAIADVAFRLGFSHQSHLSRHFKRLVGVTPKQFRQFQ